jgi:hypothetical protein
MVIAFFSASPGKRGVYVIPAIPALALASGPALVQVFRQRGAQRLFFTLAAGLGACTGVGAVFFLLQPARRIELLTSYGIDAPGPLFVTAAGAAVACLWFRPRDGLLAYALTYAVAMTVIGFWINPAINGSRSAEWLVAAVEERTRDAKELGLVAYRESFLLQFNRPTVNFGHARWREAQAEAADAAAWLVAQPGRALLMDDAAWRFCFKDATPTSIDIANDRWLLVDHGADPSCVARGRLEAARIYVPPRRE